MERITQSAIQGLKADYRKKGFTLVEMLTVVAIMAIVVSFGFSFFTATMKSGDLSQSFQFLNDQITLARQTALANNGTVEVRFYQYADPSVGETAGNPTNGKFRAVQLFLIKNAGQSNEQVVALSKSTSLPHSIIMDSNSTLSTFLATTQDKASLWSSIDPQVRIPQAGTNYNCRFFQFYPDGSTNLGLNANWCVTLHANTAGDNLPTPPANFATVEVDPYNGHVQILRP